MKLNEVLLSKEFKNVHKDIIKNKTHVKTRRAEVLKADSEYYAILKDFEESDNKYSLTFSFITDTSFIDKQFLIFKNSYNAQDVLNMLLYEDDEYYEDAIGRTYILSFSQNAGKNGKVYENLTIYECIDEYACDEEEEETKVTKGKMLVEEDEDDE